MQHLKGEDKELLEMDALENQGAIEDFFEAEAPVRLAEGQEDYLGGSMLPGRGRKQHGIWIAKGNVFVIKPTGTCLNL